LALRRGYESQEESLRAAIQAQFPKISIGLTRARDTDGFQTVGAAVSISIPIFDRNQGRIAVERATRQQLFDEYASRLFEARADVAKIAESLHSTIEQLENINKFILDLRQLVEHYYKAADRGSASILDCYQALFQLYTKEVHKLTLQRRQADLAIGLEIASGQYIFTDCRFGSGQSQTDRKSEDSK